MGALPGLHEDPGTFGAGRGTQEPSTKRHNQDPINILIAALDPLAPRSGHTRTHSIWKPRLSQGEERRKGAKQTYFNNAKNNHVNIPFCLGALLSAGGENLKWMRASRTPQTKLSRATCGVRGEGLLGDPLYTRLYSADSTSSPVCPQRIPDLRGNLSSNRWAHGGLERVKTM